MHDDYTNVYADVISMEPYYSVHKKSGSTDLGIIKVICKCYTVEGESIWVSIDINDYPNGDSKNEENNKAYYYKKSNPLRLIGEVTTSGTIIDEVEDSIGDVFVLEVEKLQGVPKN